MSYYEFLRSAWRRERKSADLIPLNHDFYEKSQAYINHLETQSKSESDELIAHLFSLRWMRSNYMINDLINLRIQKHIQATVNNKVQPSEIPTEETSYREELNSLIAGFKDQILGIAPSSADVISEESDQYNLAIFRESETNQSIGSDLRTYGPFDVGDVAFLPVENMRNFLKRSKVDRLNLDI